MSNHTIRKWMTTAACVLVALVLLGGCVKVRESFPGHSRSHVWTALKATAETPDYDDWVVEENVVWDDPHQARMEVYRETRRALYRPGARPRMEKRTWRFQITLDDGDPPTATFISRGWAIPAYARREAERYFKDVHEMLGPTADVENDSPREAEDE